MGATGQNSIQIKIRRPNPLRSEPIREWIRIVMIGLWILVGFTTYVGLASEQDWGKRWLVGLIASGIGLLIARHGRESPGLLLAVAACCAVAVIAIATASSTSGLTIAIASCAVGLALGAVAWGKFDDKGVPVSSPADPLLPDGFNEPPEME